MQKLLTIITTAIAFISGLLTQRDNAKTQLDAANVNLKEQADTIAGLQKQIADNEVDHAALQAATDSANKAAADSQAKADELAAEIAGTSDAADNLAQLINDHKDTPNVDPATFQPAPATA